MPFGVEPLDWWLLPILLMPIAHGIFVACCNFLSKLHYALKLKKTICDIPKMIKQNE